MNRTPFSLKPFLPLPTARIPKVEISGDIGRCSDGFAIRYLFVDPLGKTSIPVRADVPLRRHGLWEETCFEFFLAVKNSPSYWEFNLSPSGHWNVYRFSEYRQNMQEETRFSSLPFDIRVLSSGGLSLALEMDLGIFMKRGLPLEVGVSAVIRQKDGNVTYWALSHAGRQADFHRRDGFAVECKA